MAVSGQDDACEVDPAKCGRAVGDRQSRMTLPQSDQDGG
jgi:hypothetical protein